MSWWNAYGRRLLSPAAALAAVAVAPSALAQDIPDAVSPLRVSGGFT